MTYILIPLLIVAMLGYMFWNTMFRLRYDRVKNARERSRGRFAFRARQHIRSLLSRTFKTSNDKPDWEEALVARLRDHPHEKTNAPH